MGGAWIISLHEYKKHNTWERLKWIVQGNEKISFFKTNEKNVRFKIAWMNLKRRSFFSWTNELSDRFEKPDRFSPKEKLFWNKLFKTNSFYWTNDFIDPTFKIIIIFLLIKRFYWTIFQWQNERNRWKMNDNFDLNF